MILETLRYGDDKVSNNSSNKFNVLITSGIHGNESSAVYASYLMYYMFKEKLTEPPSWLNSITFFLGINEPALACDCREWVNLNEMSDDLNRMFPPQNLTKENIRETVKELVLQNDIVIDVHNSPICKPCYLIDNDEQALFLSFCARKTMLTPLIRDGNSNAGTIKSYVNNQCSNKLGYTIELPGMGINKAQNSEEDCAYLIDFLEKLEIPKTPKALALQKLNFSSKGLPEVYKCTPMSVASPVTGIIKHLDLRKVIDCGPETMYKEGEMICSVLDFKSKKEVPIRAPFDGYVFDFQHSYIAVKGASLLDFARNIQESWASTTSSNLV